MTAVAGGPSRPPPKDRILLGHWAQGLDPRQREAVEATILGIHGLGALPDVKSLSESRCTTIEFELEVGAARVSSPGVSAQKMAARIGGRLGRKVTRDQIYRASAALRTAPRGELAQVLTQERRGTARKANVGKAEAAMLEEAVGRYLAGRGPGFKHAASALPVTHETLRARTRKGAGAGYEALKVRRRARKADRERRLEYTTRPRVLDLALAAERECPSLSRKKKAKWIAERYRRICGARAGSGGAREEIPGKGQQLYQHYIPPGTAERFLRKMWDEGQHEHHPQGAEDDWVRSRIEAALAPKKHGPSPGQETMDKSARMVEAYLNTRAERRTIAAVEGVSKGRVDQVLRRAEATAREESDGKTLQRFGERKRWDKQRSPRTRM